MAYMETEYPFDNAVHNPAQLSPTPEFTDALALISASKGWRKWPKIISKKVYDRIREDAWAAIEQFGVPEPQKALNDFMTETVDYYLSHGTLQPNFLQYFWETALFGMFKLQIDAAVNRRVRALRAAGRRRERKMLAVNTGQIAHSVATPSSTLATENDSSLDSTADSSSNESMEMIASRDSHLSKHLGDVGIMPSGVFYHGSRDRNASMNVNSQMGAHCDEDFNQAYVARGSTCKITSESIGFSDSSMTEKKCRTFDLCDTFSGGS